MSRGRHVDRDALEQTFLTRTAYMRRTNTPIRVGEFGPVYTGDARRGRLRDCVTRARLVDIVRRFASAA